MVKLLCLQSPEIQERLAKIGKLTEKLKQFSTPQKSPNANTSLTSPRLSEPDIVYNSPVTTDKRLQIVFFLGNYSGKLFKLKLLQDMSNKIF